MDISHTLPPTLLRSLRNFFQGSARRLSKVTGMSMAEAKATINITVGGSPVVGVALYNAHSDDGHEGTVYYVRSLDKHYLVDNRDGRAYEVEA